MVPESTRWKLPSFLILPSHHPFLWFHLAIALVVIVFSIEYKSNMVKWDACENVGKEALLDAAGVCEFVQPF